MAYEEQLENFSAEAAADLSTYQYRAVVLNSSNQVALAGAGVMPIGILQNKPAAQGRAATVCGGGTSKVACGGTVTKGGALELDATGRVIDRVSGIVIGIARDSGVVGAIIPVVLQLTQ